MFAAAPSAMTQLDLDHISRRFGAVQALDDVGLSLRSGEVHALMGENGAGKSTLIRILAGLDRADRGKLTLDGDVIAQASPSAMRAAGLRFIHQELHAVPGLSIAENMHLDHPYPRRFGLVNWQALREAAATALARLGLDRLDPGRPMSELGPGDQMLVRIAATLIGSAPRPQGPTQSHSQSSAPWLYVMDEPTAALTSEESEQLFDVIADLTRQSVGVLYVSHRMPEVLRLADRVTVLRDGQKVSTRSLSETGQTRIIEEMTGRDLSGLFPPRTAPATSKVVLQGDGIRADGILSADFEVRAGEILGIVGLSGSGRGALLQSIIGTIPRQAGTLTVDGTIVGQSASDGWQRGIAYVPRERRSEGLMLGRAITENVALPHLSALSRVRFFLDERRQKRLADTLGQAVRLKAGSVSQSCAELSGGNQQKVLFARALGGEPKVLLLDEPTRGVDIGARFEIYRLIRRLGEQGLAIVMASSDLPEIIGLCDRIAVMRGGRLAETIDAAGLTEASLLARIYDADDRGQAA